MLTHLPDGTGKNNIEKVYSESGKHYILTTNNNAYEISETLYNTLITDTLSDSTLCFLPSGLNKLTLQKYYKRGSQWFAVSVNNNAYKITETEANLLAISEIGGSGGSGGQPTTITSVDPRTVITGSGTYAVTIDTTGISSSGGGGDTVSSLVYDSSTSLLTLTTDESSFSTAIVAGSGLAAPSSIVYTSTDFTRPFSVSVSDGTWTLGQTQYPSLSNPSASITSDGSLYWWDADTVTPISTTFNRGSINPQYTAATPYRSGNPNHLTIYAQGTAIYDAAFTNLTNTATYEWKDNTNFTTYATWSYDAGPQPKDSDGNNYQSPLPAGSLNTGTITKKKTLPAQYGLDNSLTETSLVDWTTTSQIDFTLPEEPSANNHKQRMIIPSVNGTQFWNTIQDILQYNPLSGQYESQPMSDYNITTSSVSYSNGTSYNSIIIAYVGSQIGTRQMRVKGGRS